MAHEEALQTLSSGVSIATNLAVTGLVLRTAERNLAPRRKRKVGKRGNMLDLI